MISHSNNGPKTGPEPRTGRDAAALRRHYLIERELADRLRRAGSAERKALYRTVYNELFLLVPDHPQNSRKVDPTRQRVRTDEQIRLLRPFLSRNAVFLEIGAGDCHLTMTAAAQVRHAYGVDVAALIDGACRRPANFSLIASDGTSIPLPDDSVDVAYSNMLFEHLHPDDGLEHLHEVYRVLTPGGLYVCRTPHRYSGPTDISTYFDDEATGFHLKEYTYQEMRAAFRSKGFSTTGFRLRVKGRSFPFPWFLVNGAELLFGRLPMRIRRKLASSRLTRPLFSCVTIVGYKPVTVAEIE